MENFYIVWICFIVAAEIHFASACNGYKANLQKMENCGGDNQVLKIDPNVTILLNPNCEIVITGCAETIGFSSASIKYTILKNGNRITSGTIDPCAELKKDSKGITSALISFGLPKECPVQKMRKCVDESQKISIAKQKSFLPLAAGTIDISIDGTHDTGKTCLHAVLNINR